MVFGFGHFLIDTSDVSLLNDVMCAQVSNSNHNENVSAIERKAAPCVEMGQRVFWRWTLKIKSTTDDVRRKTQELGIKVVSHEHSYI